MITALRTSQRIQVMVGIMNGSDECGGEKFHSPRSQSCRLCQRSSMTLRTNRLDLDALSPADYLALIESPDAFGQSFGRPAAEGLRDFIVSADVDPAWVASLRVTSEPDPWT